MDGKIRYKIKQDYEIYNHFRNLDGTVGVYHGITTFLHIISLLIYWDNMSLNSIDTSGDKVVELHALSGNLNKGQNLTTNCTS